MNPVQRAQQLGQSIWLDYIRRGLIRSGELKQMIDLGLSGITANPTILEKAIVGSTDYDEALVALVGKGLKPEQIYEALAVEDIQAVADLLKPTYDRTGAADGFPCLEISPLLAYDTDGTVKESRRLFAGLARPNVMVKVPATPQGMPAIRQLTAEGINVNVTLIFSLDVYDQVKEAYISGLEDLVKTGGDPGKVASVASFFLSRIDTAVDGLLEQRTKEGNDAAKSLLGKAAVSSAKVAYSLFEQTFNGERFARLREKGAHVQRLLWASTSTKNPAYSDLKYVEPLIGPDTVNTVPLATWQAFLDHGHVDTTVRQGLPEAEQALKSLATFGVDLKAVCDKLLADGVKAFDESFEKLMAGVEEKREKLLTEEPPGVKNDLGKYVEAVNSTVVKLVEADVARRIWRKDHTVWKPQQTEISNRLGWLTVTEQMHEQVPALEAFAREVRRAGFRKVVLLGMGGSSLGAETLRQVFGAKRGYPRLMVLDSTVPAAVQAVSKAIDPARTLFLVSSKSGTTTEPNLLYDHFKGLVERSLGKGKAGRNFVAITDPGTPLAELASREGFRRVFLNPPDIGGRYSVLSYFGLVAAALSGIDVAALLGRADAMREGCASCVPGHQNHGLWLGACMGAMAADGRDKLTILTSPSLSGFGLWAEQLIAESTGKQGKGIVPVATEPLLKPEAYGKDRWFAYLRLKNDRNEAVDLAVKDIAGSGQPVVVLEQASKYDLGAEFFRWEMAVAVAGSLLGINPFDQPDVEKAKQETVRLLREFEATGRVPDAGASGSVRDLLSQAGEGKYLAIMAYVRETARTNEALAGFRRMIGEKYHVATTLGYGPRFLHSTGQLHKGGPDSGLFLQITAERESDLPVPGKKYTFGVVADAQASGDFLALQAAGRKVVRIRAPRGDGKALDGLLTEELLTRA